MRRSSPGSFALGAGVLSAVAAPALALVLRSAVEDTARWAVIAFLAMALPGIVAGAWLAREHGRTGPAFLVALGAGWLVRAVSLGAVVVAALRQSPAALRGALAGLAVGFVTLTVFEMVWFARHTRRASLSAGSGA